jgi:hypothetical protein
MGNAWDKIEFKWILKLAPFLETKSAADRCGALDS